MADTTEFNQNEIRSRLEKIIERDGVDGIRQVGLFTSRCALRILPLLAINNQELFFSEKQRQHLMAVWRACLIRLGDIADHVVVFDRAIVANATADAAAVIAIYAKADDAVTAAKAAAKAADVVKAARAAAVRGSIVEAAAAATSYAVIDSHSIILFELKLLERESKLTLDMPLWLEHKNPLLDQVKNFQSACEILRLGQIAKDYQALLEGGERAVTVAKSWGDYETLWEEVQKYPDQPPETAQEYVVDSINGNPAPAADHIHHPGSAYWAEALPDQDHLNRGPLVDAVSQWIGDKANQQHITLGLFGHWGSGKSTFLKLLNDKLTDANRQQDTQIIWGEFNAWRYEHSENIQAGIAQEVVTALKAGLGWGNRLWLTCRYVWKQHWRQLLLLLTWLLVTAGLAFWVLETDATASKGIPRALLIPPMVLLALMWVFKFIKQATSHPLANILKTYLRLPHFGEHLGTIPVMHEQIKVLLSIRLTIVDRPFWKVLTKKPKQRFVFVVDDLDRCSPEGVVKTLEAVRLVMDLPNVVVIIAIDPRVALAALALHYEKLSEHHTADPVSIARDYLGKVVHVPIVLEEPPETDIHAYLDQHLWKDDEAVPEESARMPRVRADTTAASDRPQPGAGSGTDSTTETGTETSTETNAASSEDNQPEHSARAASLEANGAMNPATAAESDPAAESLQRPAIRLTGLSPAQKQTFKHWISVFRFSNPRQIKRLNNAYALVRLRYTEDQPLVEGDDHEFQSGQFPRLVIMHWLEYVQELSTEDRCVLLACFEEGAVIDPVFGESANQEPLFKKERQRHIRLWQQVREAVPDDELFLLAYRETRAFVLPAVERVIPKSQSENTTANNS